MSAEEAVKLAGANNGFALDLYKNLLKSDPKAENVFFSPFSMGTALCMAQLGAKDETAAQMKKTLNLDCFPGDDHHRVISEVCAKFKTDDDEKYTLSVANRLFARKDYQFCKEFLGNTRKLYAADAQNLDFAGDVEGSKKTMNTWVEDQTANKIKNLITDIDPQLAMVLINAIYFKGNWLEQFKPEDTNQMEFHVTEAETIQVPMMFRDDKFNTGYSPELEAMSLEVPYKGEEVSMVFILPTQRNQLAALEEKLTAETLKPLLACEDNMKMNVYLPKFKMECKLDLEQQLQQLGMTHAFQQGVGDFSGMDGTRNLYLSKVVHKAYIEVNEEGTEAAAATGLQMMLMCMPMQFQADHPFLFCIKHRPTGAAIFWGRCSRPSYE